MDTYTTLDADTLLALPSSDWMAVFGEPGEPARLAYRRMIRRWHPDRNADPRAHDIFIKLHDMYQRMERQSAGVKLTLRDEKGRTWQMSAREKQSFELGNYYRARRSLAYQVDADHKALFDNFQNTTRSFGYANAKMREHIEPGLPHIQAAHWGEQGGLIVLPRPSGSVRLADVLKHYKSQGLAVPAKHVGWILNGLYSLGCYLAYSKLAHQAIGSSTVWIDPAKHSVMLLGGWFYSRPMGQSIRVLPAWAAANAPRSYIAGRESGHRLDMELIHALGRELLGDRAGQRMRPDTPKPITDALRLPATGTALEQYQSWKQVLLECFGPPKFVDMALAPQHIYKGE
jgi:hypothetical protein